MRDVNLPTAHYTISDLESWATGTSRCLSKTRSRSYADEFSGGGPASRVRRHHGPGRRLLPGTLPPRLATWGGGGLPSVAPTPLDQGRPRGGGKVRHLAIMKHVGEYIVLFDIRYGSAATHEHQTMEVLELARPRAK